MWQPNTTKRRAKLFQLGRCKSNQDMQYRIMPRLKNSTLWLNNINSAVVQFLGEKYSLIFLNLFATRCTLIILSWKNYQTELLILPKQSCDGKVRIKLDFYPCLDKWMSCRYIFPGRICNLWRLSLIMCFTLIVYTLHYFYHILGSYLLIRLNYQQCTWIIIRHVS